MFFQLQINNGLWVPCPTAGAARQAGTPSGCTIKIKGVFFMRYIFILLVTTMYISCSSPEYVYRHSNSSTSITQENIRGGGIENKPLITERMLQYNAFISMASTDTDSLFKKVLELTIQNEGYMLHSEKKRITIRIPSSQFVPFINSLSSIGTVLSKNIEGTDVTEEFFDLSTRLDNAQKTRQRYLELLNRAQNVEQALSVERELERLNRDIDLLSGRLNKLKHLSDFSTVTVTTNVPVRPGPIGYVFYGLYSALKWLFVWN